MESNPEHAFCLQGEDHAHIFAAVISRILGDAAVPGEHQFNQQQF